MDKSIDKKNRITIFAHFDRDNLVDDYVILYLKGLREVSEKIIFVSDGKIIEEEKFKLSELCSDIIDEKHGEYDFGSHKRGFNFFKEKYSQEFESAKEIIFANDSCYLIKSLVPIFNKMSVQKLDAWGIIESFQYEHNHLHSYFFVLCPTAFKSKIFSTFLNNVRPEKSQDLIIEKYEVGMTKTLAIAGFKIGSFFGKMSFKDIGNKEILKNLITQGYPFLKIRNLVSGYFTTYEFNKFFTDSFLQIINKNLIRRIGQESLLKSYQLLCCFEKVFFHKKFFLVKIKQGKFLIKIFGIRIFKINLV